MTYEGSPLRSSLQETEQNQVHRSIELIWDFIVSQEICDVLFPISQSVWLAAMAIRLLHAFMISLQDNQLSIWNMLHF